MLWQCLTGELPFKGKGPVDIMRRVVDEGPDLGSGSSGTSRDLITLAERCLEKDPHRRISSAGEFADELDRWLRGDPLLVRPITSGERLWKWVKRKPAWAALGAALIMGGLVSLGQWQRAEQAVDSLTESNAQLTQSLAQAEATSLASEARLHVIEDPTRALLLAVESVELTERSGQGVLPETAAALTETLQRVGGVDISPFGPRPSLQNDGFIDRAPALNYPVRVSPDGQWALVLDHCTDASIVTAAVFDLKNRSSEPIHRWTYLDGPNVRRAEGWLSGSRRFITVDPEGRVRLWTPRLKGLLKKPASAPDSRLLGRFGVSGTLVRVALTSAGEGTLSCKAVFEQESATLLRHYHIDPAEGESVQLVREQELTDTFARGKTNWHLSPCHRWAVGQDHQVMRLVRLSDRDSSRVDEWTFPGEKMWFSPTFSVDGRWLALRHSVRALEIIDLDRNTAAEAAVSRRELFVHAGAIEPIAFSPDARWVAAGGRSAEVTVASTDGRSIRKLKVRGENVLGVQFSPDGNWIGAGSREGAVTVWPMAALTEGAEPLVLRGLPTPALDIAFSPSSDSLVASGMSSHFRHWPRFEDRVGRIPDVLPGRADAIQDLALSPDKRWIALACAIDHADAKRDKGLVKLIDVTGGEEEQVLGFHSHAASGVAFSANGEWMASTGIDGFVNVWNLAETVSQFNKDTSSIPPRHVFDLSYTRLQYLRRVAFHPRGTLYATCGDGILFEWDLNARHPASTVREHRLHSIGYLLPDVTVSPNGRWLAVAGHGWDLKTPEGGPQHGNMVLLYDVSEPNTMTLIAALPAEFFGETSVRFSRDNRWLASGSAGHGALVWDLHANDIAASRVEAPVSAHLLGDVAFSDDGRFLGLAGSDGRVHLWDWRSQQRPRTIVTGNAESALAWLDNSRLMVGGVAGRIAVWETSVEELKSMARAVAGRELSSKERESLSLGLARQ